MATSTPIVSKVKRSRPPSLTPITARSSHTATRPVAREADVAMDTKEGIAACVYGKKGKSAGESLIGLLLGKPKPLTQSGVFFRRLPCCPEKS